MHTSCYWQMKLKLAYSPCPNDTFMFGALVLGLIPHAYDFEVVLEDIKDLNSLARQQQADVCKVSFYAYTQLQGWSLLDSGAALGQGVGPLLVARQPIQDLAQTHIAIPGADTTANLLLAFYAPQARHKTVRLFSEIMPAVAAGEYDAGLIIHESRFTYPQYGLLQLADLGSYWEQQTQLPIPLGGIVARESLRPDVRADLARLIRASIAYARQQPEAVLPYVRAHAQEMEETVMLQHIALYVNDYSLELGQKGRAAVEKLRAVAEQLKKDN